MFKLQLAQYKQDPNVVTILDVLCQTPTYETAYEANNPEILMSEHATKTRIDIDKLREGAIQIS